MNKKLRSLIKAQIQKAFRSLARARSGPLNSRGQNSQSGQGVLEYILVLVITMVVILGLVYQFNAKFKLFAEQFFDGYIACLLETGELPGVTNATCEEEYKSLSDMQAKGLLKFPDSAPGGGASAKNAAQKTAEESAKGKSPDKRETVGGGGGGATTNFGNFGRARSGGDRSTAVGRTEASKDGNESLGYSGSNNRGGSFYGASGAGSKVNTTYMFDGADALDDTAKGKPAVAKTDKKNEDARALKPRRALEDPSRRSTASIDISEGEFSFGEMIRWLIIGALILAIIIFFGGQLLQIMRSREKGGVE